MLRDLKSSNPGGGSRPLLPYRLMMRRSCDTSRDSSGSLVGIGCTFSCSSDRARPRQQVIRHLDRLVDRAGIERLDQLVLHPLGQELVHQRLRHLRVRRVLGHGGSRELQDRAFLGIGIFQRRALFARSGSTGAPGCRCRTRRVAPSPPSWRGRIERVDAVLDGGDLPRAGRTSSGLPPPSIISV